MLNSRRGRPYCQIWPYTPQLAPVQRLSVGQIWQ
jgi:hypothetical protein